MRKSNFLLPIIIGVFALLFSINNTSIWIDEMLTYQVVHESSFSKMFLSIWNTSGANGGMPLYFILEWVCTLFTGYDEVGLRILNIPFAIVYFFFSWLIIRKSLLPSGFIVLFFLHPLFIYYMNEARPYIILLSLGSIYTYLLFFSNLNDYKTLIWLYCTFLIGLLTHMMFVFMIFMYLVQCMQLVRSHKLEYKKHLSVFGMFAILYLAILYYYINIMTGAGEIGGVGALIPNWKASIIQIIYYFTGFGGLGLSRNEIRAMLFSQLSYVHIICIALMSVSYLIFLLYIIRNKLWKKTHLLYIFLPGFVTFSIFCIINILIQTRFWERHIIYLLPVFLLFICSILKLMINSKKIIYKTGAILIISLTVISGLRTMFDKYYEKEDYKGVSAYIKDKEDALFLLQGDSLIYNYYGIEFKNDQIQLINNISKEDLDKITLGNNVELFLVLSSRGEFDSGKLYHLIYKTKDIKYNSFRIIQYSP